MDLENSINEMRNLAKSGSDYREKFNIRSRGEDLTTLMLTYLRGIPKDKKSQYDNEDMIRETIQKYGFNISSFTGRRLIDIIDFIRYYSWYRSKGVSIEQISELIQNVKASEEIRVEVDGRIFTWNKRKSELTRLERGFDFYDAVKVLTSAAHEVVKGEGNIWYAFQKYCNREKYYFVVELKKLEEEERILSFRLTSDEEYKKIKEKYNVQK